MIKSWKQFVQYWYVFCIIVMIASLPFSKILLSIGQFMMAGGWIAERFDELAWWRRARQRPWWLFLPVAIPDLFYSLGKGIVSGFRQFLENRAAVLFTSIILLHLAGLFFTTDMQYAFKDIRTKLPILLLPLFLSTSAGFSEKAFRRFMLLFVAALLVRTGYNAWLIAGHHYIDIRDVSRNVSHIILSLELTLAIFTLAFFILKKEFYSLWHRAGLMLLLAWFIVYLLISRSFTGLAVTMLVLFILIPLLIVQIGDIRVKGGLVFVILILTGTVIWGFRSVVGDYYRVNDVDFQKLEKSTSRGNPYIHNIYANETENGNYLWVYIQWDEMRQAWNSRSAIPFDSVNMKGETNAYTVVRFLTSKGWRKDADAVERLTNEEVAAIEKGVANHIFLQQFSVRGRIYEFLWGYENYRKTGNPTGSSVMQRLEFWKASMGIIRDHWLTGVGTGDMNTAFSEQYEKMQTKLDPSQRWRSHNQYFSILIGMGVFGLLWFLIAIILPPFMMRRAGDYFIMVFLLIIGISMLTEDTIETQMGVTFFAFFYSFFLFARKDARGDSP